MKIVLLLEKGGCKKAVIIPGMLLTEFAAVRAELIAIENFDRIQSESQAPLGNEETLAFVFRRVRRHELLKQFADLVAKN